MLITAIIARIHRNGFMKNIFHSHAKVVLVILISFLGQGLHGQTFLGHIFGTTVGGHKVFQSACLMPILWQLVVMVVMYGFIHGMVYPDG